MKTNFDLIMIVVGIVILAGMVLFPAYSNYSVCKEYYPKINSFVCMMSSKTRVLER